MRNDPAQLLVKARSFLSGSLLVDFKVVDGCCGSGSDTIP